MKYFNEEERKQAAKESSARYYLKNREACLARNAEWCRNNKERLSLKSVNVTRTGLFPIEFVSGDKFWKHTEVNAAIAA